MEPRAVILAAGSGSRMGRQKLLEPFRGRPMIEYAIEAASEWRPLIVAGTAVSLFLKAREGLATIVNDAPQRGMAHSLRLVNAALSPDTSIVVMLADKPLITRALITTVCDLARGADIAYPVSGRGEPGHPVFFSPRARTKIRELPDGDSIKLLRDDAALTKRTFTTDDTGAFFDIDTADQLSS